MSSEGWQRIPAAGGIIYAVGLVASGFIVSSPPEARSSAQKMTAYVTANHHALQATALVDALLGVVLLSFVAYLWTVLHRQPGGDFPAALVLMGGLSLVLVSWVQTMAITGLATMADQTVGPAIYPLIDFGEKVVPLIILSVSVFAAAGGIGIVTTRVLPSWLGWAALLIAIAALVVGSTGFFTDALTDGAFGIMVEILFALWLLITSGLLTLDGEREAGVRTPEARPATTG